jgi:hypothetical protein
MEPLVNWPGLMGADGGTQSRAASAAAQIERHSGQACLQLNMYYIVFVFSGFVCQELLAVNMPVPVYARSLNG